MDMKQAQAKLSDISRSTGIRNPKILIGELCTVINFLLKEIDSIKSPPISLLSKQPIDLPATTPPETPGPPGPPYRSPPFHDPVRKFRKGNVGDAE